MRRLRFSCSSLPARWLGVLLLGIGLTVGAQAQQSPDNRKPPQLPQTPEVHADHSVTFYFYDPGASQVDLSMDGHAGGQPMTKDDRGVWSITVPPLQPDLYDYLFVADGVPALDPSNAARQSKSAKPVKCFRSSRSAVRSCGMCRMSPMGSSISTFINPRSSAISATILFTRRLRMILAAARNIRCYICCMVTAMMPAHGLRSVTPTSSWII